MKSRFLKLHDNGRLVIINVDEIRAIEPYEESEEVDEDYEEDYDEDDEEEDEDFDDEEEEESDREEVDFEKERNEGGSKSVISYKGLKGEYTWVDETPEEIWDMLE